MSLVHGTICNQKPVRRQLPSINEQLDERVLAGFEHDFLGSWSRIHASLASTECSNAQSQNRCD